MATQPSCACCSPPCIPNQTSALVTLNGFARLRRAADYAWGYPPEAEEAAVDAIRRRMGDGTHIPGHHPGLVEGPRGAEWVARLERSAGSPRRAANKQRLVFDIDVRDVLPAVSAPTLVIHTRNNTFAHPAHAQYLVDNIAGARFVELPGADHSPGFRGPRRVDGRHRGVLDRDKASCGCTDRSLMTVAFTDIVGSTQTAADLGDRRWRRLLEVHESVGRREIEDARGR